MSSTWRETLLKNISGDFSGHHINPFVWWSHKNTFQKSQSPSQKSCINIQGQTSSIPCLFVQVAFKSSQGGGGERGVSDS